MTGLDRHPRHWSLAERLVLLTVLPALVVLALGGWWLRHEMQASLYAGMAHMLEDKALRIAARLEVQDGDTLQALPSSGDEFSAIFSGWYWQVLRADRGVEGRAAIGIDHRPRQVAHVVLRVRGARHVHVAQECEEPAHHDHRPGRVLEELHEILRSPPPDPYAALAATSCVHGHRPPRRSRTPRRGAPMIVLSPRGPGSDPRGVAQHPMPAVRVARGIRRNLCVFYAQEGPPERFPRRALREEMDRCRP